MIKGIMSVYGKLQKISVYGDEYGIARITDNESVKYHEEDVGVFAIRRRGARTLETLW